VGGARRFRQAPLSFLHIFHFSNVA
jgi:hypothetical protein